ncbi:hypothetical protein [Paenibacillus donghaensis]|uniref:Uncharacterized protein n=1 Tax=Paenibacillus donghaensis TaxID=414771 RepID=A0A2Z2K9P1_9BACL|nr:hypothetical protein [Paenibacillus donghaensis]ASA19473.1 hypothetical protein B9T62_00555 [Paenibacillus donghaensis]
MYSDNMHHIYEVDIFETLAREESTLQALFRSHVEYVTRKQVEFPIINNADAVPDISHLRKAILCSAGNGVWIGKAVGEFIGGILGGIGGVFIL